MNSFQLRYKVTENAARQMYAGSCVCDCDAQEMVNKIIVKVFARRNKILQV